MGEAAGSTPRARRGYRPGVAKKKTARRSTEADPDDLSALSFEDALDRVEAINDRIESGEIGLEASLAEYERGSRLLEHCRRILERTELRFRELASPDDESEESPA